ncbi:MAG: phosphatidylglycerophosphatase A family protein [Sulfuriferula sp.]
MRTLRADWRFVIRHPAHFLAFGFGSGLAPVAPGTFGTLAAVPLYYLLTALLTPDRLYMAIGLAALAGIWICDITGRNLGVADYGGIVWDEIVAFWCVLLFTPGTVLWVAGAFIVFRVFDIWKPFPINWFDTHVKNGLGVMLDDWLAAAYTIIILAAARHWLI